MIAQLFCAVVLLSLTGTALYLVMKLLVYCCGSRLSQSWRYHGAVVIALMFLLPAYKLCPAPVEIPAEIAVASPAVSADSGEVHSEPTASAPSVEASPLPSLGWRTVAEVCTAVWLAVACLVLLWKGGCLLYLSGQLRHAPHFRDQAWNKAAGEEAARLGIRQTVTLLESPFAPSPMLTGWFRPVILLPPEPLSPEDAQLILRHELIHFRRLDLWKKGLVNFICAIHWFNPAVYLLRRDLSRWMETSCDEAVVSALDFHQRKQYGYLLIQFAAPSRSVPGSAFLSFSTPRDQLERRIKTMLHSNKKSKTVVSLILAAALIVCCAATSVFAAQMDATVEPTVEETTAERAAVLNEGPGPGSEDGSAALSEDAYEKAVIEGEVGDKIVCGSLIFEIVSEEEVDQAASDSQGISLSGDSLSKSFNLTTSMPYAKVWIKNTSSGDLIFTITKSSPTGTVVSGSNVTIKSGTSTSVYSTNAWSADTYYANFTSGKVDMSGSAACRIASTMDELDVS